MNKPRQFINRHFRCIRRQSRGLWAAAVLSVLSVMSACSDKPPGCADSDTSYTLQKMVADNVLTVLEKQVADDPDNWIRQYATGIKVDLTGVVSEGYSAERKKQSCKGTLKITSIDGATAQRSVVYSTQVTEDRRGSFVLEVQDIGPFIGAVSSSANKYYVAHRWAGTWSGTYACSGIDGATAGPQGPYAMPVSMQVVGTAAKLERTTRGGGFETLEGDFSVPREDRLFHLQGVGQNSEDDKWYVGFKGKVQGKKLLAQGAIGLPNKLLRSCTLDLTLGAPLPTPISVTSTAGPSGAAQPAQASAPPALAAAPAAPRLTADQEGAARTAGSLCKSPETVLFSCNVGRNKVVSVCQDSDLASAALVLSYRIGVIGEEPEMVYPNDGRFARDAFQYGAVSAAELGGDFLSFDIRDFRYVVYAAEGKSWKKQGVVTDRGEKRLGSTLCKADVINNLEPRALAIGGLRQDTRSFEAP